MESLKRLASLLAERNRVDGEIAKLIGRPALSGHIGEFIASELFDIELEAAATSAGIDGHFRSGPLAGRSVNVKLYGNQDGVLDISAMRPDYYLVLTGPPPTAMSSKGQTRPVVVDQIFLFDAQALLASLVESGVTIGVATSVKKASWSAARIWPAPSVGALLTVTEVQAAALRELGSSALLEAAGKAGAGSDPSAAGEPGSGVATDRG